MGAHADVAALLCYAARGIRWPASCARITRRAHETNRVFGVIARAARTLTLGLSVLLRRLTEAVELDLQRSFEHPWANHTNVTVRFVPSAILT